MLSWPDPTSFLLPASHTNVLLLVPSWLLRNPGSSLRTTNKDFIEAVDNYFDHLIPKILPLQVKMSLLSLYIYKAGGRSLVENESTLLAGLEKSNTEVSRALALYHRQHDSILEDEFPILKNRGVYNYCKFYCFVFGGVR